MIISYSSWELGKQTKEQGGSLGVVKSLMRRKFQITSHRIERKWPFMDATKESFWFEISFFKYSDLVKTKSQGLERSVRWPAGNADGGSQTKWKTQPHATISLKGYNCLMQSVIRLVSKESRRAGGSWRSRD